MRFFKFNYKTNKLIFISRIAFLFLCFCHISNAQQPITKEQDAKAINSEIRSEAIKILSDLLIQKYVFAETAEKMSKQLRENLRSGKYNRLNNADEFAAAVLKDLRQTSNDKHLNFFYNLETFEGLSKKEDAGLKQKREIAEQAEERYKNYYFNKVDRLDGNIGYIELLQFSSQVGGEAGQVAVAAMNFVANSDALIIDLRKNPGGSGRMGQLLMSYLFDSNDDRWLMSNYNRSKGTTRQEWTQPFVPGKRMPDTPVYILISRNTGSAAEGFAYTLQAMKRAVIVGEISAGGAHSGELILITKGLVLFTPEGRTIQPDTLTNWEGVGVKPDVEVKSADALIKAESLIFEKLKEKNTDEQKKTHADWLLKVFGSKLAPVIVDKPLLESYAGNYEENTKIIFEAGNLYFQSNGGAKSRLTALDKNLFTVEGADYYGADRQRVLFVTDEKNKVIKIITLINYDSGKIATFEDKKLDI